jgi:hypothetical protein
MAEADGAARAADLDDVVVKVSTVRYGDRTAAVRLDLEQRAFDDKTYVDLSVEDARWLAAAVSSALNEIAEG